MMNNTHNKMKSYKALKQQQFTSGEYSIVPIRSEDRYDIMEWRNEQMYHLRQKEALTKESQDFYFDSVVESLFENNEPPQILFSYLEGEKCIGYGGLVHINWTDKNAEISFIMNTRLEKENFEFHWTNFLNLLEEVAWKELDLHKIYTYAFDLRPHIYPALARAGFALEVTLKEHSFFEGNYIDVKIHSKFNKKSQFRNANLLDANLTFNWANTPGVRAFSYNKDKISYKEHINWYYDKLQSSNCEYYILEICGNPAGSIRFDIEENHFAKINYLLDPSFTGKGLGTYLLENGLQFLNENRPSIQTVYGFVLKENLASIRIFEKLSFKKVSEDTSELKFEKPI